MLQSEIARATRSPAHAETGASADPASAVRAAGQDTCAGSESRRTGGPRTLNVSIVLYGTDPKVVEDCLVSLAVAVRQARQRGLLGETRIHLADHSPRATDAKIRERWHELGASCAECRYRHDPRNPGYGAGHNATFEFAPPADLFLVANPDVVFAPNALEGALTFLAAHPEVGVLAPALLQHDGLLRPGCFRDPDPWTLLLRAIGLDARRSRRIALYECRDWDPGKPVLHPPHMSGCCLLFRSAAFRRLGGFDPGYFVYFDDFDLSRRARDTSAYCPDMRVRHLGGGASRKGWRHRWWFARSAWRYYRRWGRPAIFR